MEYGRASGISARPERVKSVFELDVYRLAYQLSLDVHVASHKFPKTEQYGGVADQMRRASKSVCANLAEGWGKWSTSAERSHFTRIALGSATEMQVWLSYARDLNFLAPKDAAAHGSRYEDVARMLAGLLKNGKKGD